MPSDSKISKKEQSKKTKKREIITRSKKMHKDSDDDSDYDDYDDDDDVEMDMHEYRKLLGKLFPSKHMNQKIKLGEKDKKRNTKKEEISESEESENDDSEWEEEDEEEERSPKKKHVNQKNKSKKNDKKSSNLKKSKKYEESDEESEYETYDEDDSEEEENQLPNSHGGKFNIIFTIGSGENDEEDDEEWDEDYDDDDSLEDEETEDEDEEVSTDESSSEDESDDESFEERKPSPKKNKIKNEKTVTNKKEETESTKKDDVNIASLVKDMIEKCSATQDEKIDTDENILKNLKEINEKNKGNKIIKECIKVCEKELNKKKKKQEKKITKTKEKHERIFRKVIRDKNTMNDFAFFKTLDIVEQKKIIKEVREINKITRVEMPYRLTLLGADIPPIFKASAMKKINSLRYMEPGSGEYYKIKNWVDTFMRIPFGKYNSLPISISDGVEKCHDFMAHSQQLLENAVYGLNDAKMQIMQMLGQLVTNPKAIGTAIAIHGPPGTGKTSLVKEGISKILDRPFAFIALGGATDSSFLEGHSYTYEGSVWGKIVQILIDSKCMNPVIYFDELDKISDTPKGEEIAGILTHLTDTSQNSQFHDKYFAEIDFDLSKCLFIFSYNDETKVNSILKDRMYRIKTKGYDKKQKTVISDKYLLPKIREQVKFETEDIVIPQETIHHIIDNHCNKEDGVRNLKRCLEIIYTKLNLYRLMKPESNLFAEDMALKVEFPFTVTKDIVDKLIKTEKDINSALYSMYV
jgi:hypothetical protein